MVLRRADKVLCRHLLLPEGCSYELSREEFRCTLGWIYRALLSSKQVGSLITPSRLCECTATRLCTPAAEVYTFYLISFPWKVRKAMALFNDRLPVLHLGLHGVPDVTYLQPCSSRSAEAADATVVRTKKSIACCYCGQSSASLRQSCTTACSSNSVPRTYGGGGHFTA